jgi:hemerythrin-like domain-containing protein
MAIQIGAKPDSGFDDPLGMLKDCHRRIERFLHLLCWVPGKAQGRALNGEERQAVEAALQYFCTSGPLHTEDEEQSLFPRMRSAGAGDVINEMARLEADHQRAAGLHEAMASTYVRWLQDGVLPADEEARLQQIAREMQQIYGEHIRIEEEVVFPRAAEVLDRSVLPSMGEEFKARRERH